MNKKMGLGKGLEALIPGRSTVSENILCEIPLSQIKPNLRQPRQKIDEEKLMELSASIKEHGVVQPIITKKHLDGSYIIVAGERRWRACQMAGLKKIPAIITAYSDEQAAEISLIENLQREDLNPLEEAMAYQRLIEQFGLKQEDVANKVGKSRSQITNMIRLLSLPAEILSMITDKLLSVGHARALLAINDSYKQLSLAKEIIKKEMSVRETEKLCKNIIAPEDKKPKENLKKLDPEIFDIQENLQHIFSTKVQIKSNKAGKGKLEIEFYTNEDLNRILDIINSIH